MRVQKEEAEKKATADAKRMVAQSETSSVAGHQATPPRQARHLNPSALVRVAPAAKARRL